MTPVNDTWFITRFILEPKWKSEGLWNPQKGRKYNSISLSDNVWNLKATPTVFRFKSYEGRNFTHLLLALFSTIHSNGRPSFSDEAKLCIWRMQRKQRHSYTYRMPCSATVATEVSTGGWQPGWSWLCPIHPFPTGKCTGEATSGSLLAAALEHTGDWGHDSSHRNMPKSVFPPVG